MNTSSTGRLPAVRGRRLTGATGLGLASVLVLASCGSDAGGGGEEPSPISPAGEATTSATGTPTPSAAASPTATDTATDTATASPTDRQNGPLAGPSQTYTTESGIFTWTLPADWTIDVDDDLEGVGGSGSGGIPYEVVQFSNREDTVSVTAVTGIGPSDNEGWKPEIVEVIEAEELTDLPVAEAGGENDVGTGPVYLRTALSEVTTEPPSMEGVDDLGEVGDFGLEIQIVNVDAGVDPMDPADYFSSWQYFLDPPAGAGDDVWGTSNIFAGGFDQEDAEKITGLQGEEAVRSLLDTEEYATLRAVLASVEVTLP